MDVFGVFWDVLGYRNNGWAGTPDFTFFREKMNPEILLVEPFNREAFIQRFSSDQWKQRPQLSCSTTSGDAASMWYGIYRCFREIQNYQTKHEFTYDIICRVRTDMIYDTALETKEIDDMLSRDVIYMPKWRGKYYETCRGIADYVGMGNYNVMKHYMSTFMNIPKYLRSNDYIHTGEGFLLAQLEGYTVERTSVNFSMQRDGYVEDFMR